MGWPQWVIAGLYLANLVVLVSKETVSNRTTQVIITILIVLTLYMAAFTMRSEKIKPTDVGQMTMH